MKKLFLFAAAAFMVACSSDDLTVDNQKQAQLEEGVVGFDAYMQRVTTRAGLTSEDLKLPNLKTEGFGVFGYYTDNKDYDQTALPNFFYNQEVKDGDDDDVWTYSPLKYWPNEYGYNAISDDADKVSFFAYAPFVNVEPGTGKVKPTAAVQTAYDDAKTAYETAKTTQEGLESAVTSTRAAWVAWCTGNSKDPDSYTPGSGNDGYTEYSAWQTAISNLTSNATAWTTAKTNWAAAETAYAIAGSSETGITSMTRNSNAGDPIIKYVASFDNNKAVDLCWGVCQQVDWQLVETGQTQEFILGKPWLNVQRPGAVDQNLKFMFKHATAKMQIFIDEYNDAYQPAADDDGDINKEETRIWVRSVRLSGFTMQGALNLNNETANDPYWMNYSGLGDLSVTEDVMVYDQRKDGKEGVAGAVATNEKVGGLNEQLIQKEGLVSGDKWTDTRKGVRHAKVSLFQTANETNKWFYVIPSGDDMEIEIVYDVETINKSLYNNLSDGETKGSSIENRITKKIKFGDNISKLEAGKAYQVNLHLGMNDVDFDADIVDWDNMPTPDIDLPANMPVYAIGTTAGNIGTIEIPGAAEGFDFAVTGLKGGQAVTAVTSDAAIGGTATWGSTSGSTNKNVNASGVLYVKVASIAAGDQNTTIVDKTTDDAITITTSQDGTQKLTVIQKAEALGLVAPGTGSLTLKRKVLGSTAWSDANTACPTLTGFTAGTNNYIRVWRNGTELTYSGAGAAGFTFNNATGEISLGAVASGDVIKVTIKASTVAEETITFTY